MSLQSDQATKTAKRAAAHANHVAAAAVPATAVADANTDPPTVLAAGAAPVAYPSPPF
jgi:hypothetical protein